MLRIKFEDLTFIDIGHAEVFTDKLEIESYPDEVEVMYEGEDEGVIFVQDSMNPDQVTYTSDSGLTLTIRDN